MARDIGLLALGKDEAADLGGRDGLGMVKLGDAAAMVVARLQKSAARTAEGRWPSGRSRGAGAPRNRVSITRRDKPAVRR
jgi:hypothetical protein